MIEQAMQFVPAFVLAFFRLAALTMSMPLFGSARVPRRVKLLFAIILAWTHAQNSPVIPLPSSVWQLTLGIGGEMVFGLAMGSAMSFVFVAVNWAGEIIGQQMGLNLGEVFDPAMGQQASLVGDLYFLLTLVMFLIVGGHRAMLRGVENSFTALPLLSVGINQGILSLLVGLLNSAMGLAMQLAAPMLVTALIVDLVLGFLGKTMPQMNLMAAGLSIRAGVGIAVLAVGLGLGSDVIRSAMNDSLRQVYNAWSQPASP